MSFKWNSQNRRGRLQIYSDDIATRFDKLTSAMDARARNSMIVHEDYQTGERRETVAEECVLWEDERYVYMQLRGRIFTRTEAINETVIPRRHVSRRPISVFEE